MEQRLTNHPDYSYVYAGRQADLRGYGIDLQPLQFSRVAEQISKNPTMLPKDPNALFARYERGDLCALVARRTGNGQLEDQVLGTVTMDLLMDVDLLRGFFSDELGAISERFPNYVNSFPALYELGAVDLDPTVRGYKLAHLIHDAALAPHAENIRRRRAVVVLTTQRPEEVLTIDSTDHTPTPRDPLVKQLEFKVYARGQVPGVDVFTCTCNSKKKRGYGVAVECPSVVTEVPTHLRRQMIELLQAGQTEIACHIGISSGEFARHYSEMVMALGRTGRENESVEPLQHVVRRLREGGYYE